jgi:hypothetical protein
LKLQPAQANAVADTLRRRIIATMPVPEKSLAVSEWRAIQQYPKRNPELVAQLRRSAPQIDQEGADDIWRLVFQYGRDLPIEVMVKLTAAERTDV